MISLFTPLFQTTNTTVFGILLGINNIAYTSTTLK